MAASADLRLIAKIADVGEIKPVIDAGITPDKFKDQDARLMFSFILNYYKHRKTMGNVPDRALLDIHYPTVDLPPPDRLLLTSTIDEFLGQHVKVQVSKLIDYMSRAEDVPSKMLPKAQLMINDIIKDKRISVDIVVSDALLDARQRYEESKHREILKGIPYPWKVLNDETQGMQNGEYIIFYGRPKCIAAGQRVMGPDGSLVEIETPPDEVPSTSGMRITWGACSGTYAGKKQTIRVETTSGHILDVGVDHPLLVPNMTFLPAQELNVGAYIGVARQLPDYEPSEDALGVLPAALLGYLIGDGGYTTNRVTFTKSDKGIVRRVAELSSHLGAELRPIPSGKPYEYSIVGTSEHTRSNPVLKLLRNTGCAGLKANAKRVPERLFRSSKNSIAAFLSGYLDTDGTVGKNVVSWCSASYELIRDVKHLLLRFGITGSISHVRTNYDTDAWHLYVHAQEQHVRLNEILTLHSKHKRIKLQKLATAKIDRKRQDDGIPYSEALMADILTAKGNKEWKHLWSGFSKGKLFRRTGRISRHLLRRLAKYLNAPNLLNWANSDIRWEPIKSITPLGVQDCYDITMEKGEPIFVVEDFITHNSLKTFVGLKVSVHAYDAAGRRILIYTREMSPQQMMDRVLCMLIGAPYDAFKKGYLHDIPHPFGHGTMEDAFYSLLSTMKGDENQLELKGKHKTIVVTSDRGDPEGGGVGGLRRKIEDHRPDLAFVDAVYLMRNDRSGVRSVKWSDQAGISQDLKEVAQDFNIPLVATLQANRGSEHNKGESTANMAYSDSYAQDCDLATEIIKKKVDPFHNELALAITASRETNMSGFAIHGDPCENFDILYKPVLDKYEKIQIGLDGQPLMEPVIFQETSDIWKMFKKNEDGSTGEKKPHYESAVRDSFVKTKFKKDTTPEGKYATRRDSPGAT